MSDMDQLHAARKALYRFCEGKQIMCVPAQTTDDDFLISAIFSKYEALLSVTAIADSALKSFRAPRNKYPEIVKRLADEALSDMERAIADGNR